MEQNWIPAFAGLTGRREKDNMIYRCSPSTGLRACPELVEGTASVAGKIRLIPHKYYVIKVIKGPSMI